MKATKNGVNIVKDNDDYLEFKAIIEQAQKRAFIEKTGVEINYFSKTIYVLPKTFYRKKNMLVIIENQNFLEFTCNKLFKYLNKKENE